VDLTLEQVEKIPFVFIVSRGRSGTTLLQNILDANEQVISPVESKLIIHLKKKYRTITQWTPTVVDELIIDLYKESKFQAKWYVDRLELKNRLLSLDLKRITFTTICKCIYLSYPSPFSHQNIKLIGDKNPVYSTFIPELLELFPDAKFIHLIRDYRDNAVSNREAFGRTNVAALGNGWLTFNLCIEKEKAKNPTKFFTLKYEDLAGYPQQKIKNLCDFLGLFYNDNMLNYHQKISEIKSKLNIVELDSIHKNLVNPVNTANVKKWENILTKKEEELLDFICGDYGKKYNYLPKSQYKKKGILWLKSLIGKAQENAFILTIKTYYKLPFFIRDFLRFVSIKLYRIFKFSTYFNHADFAFSSDKK